MVTKQRSTVGRPSRMKIHCQPSRGVCSRLLVYQCVGFREDIEHKTERKNG